MTTAAPTSSGIAEKIGKLLAQASSTNFAEEAQAFLAKARQMMLQHHVEQDDVDTAMGVKRQVVVKDALCYTVPQREAWMDGIATILAKEFRCKWYLQQYGKMGMAYCVMGLEDDVAIAQPALAAGYAMSHRNGWKWCAKTRRPGRPKEEARKERMSWHEGFNRGLADRMKAEMAQLTQSQALILFVPQEVQDRYAQQITGKSVTTTRMYAAGRVDRAWGDGYQAGKQFNASSHRALAE